MIRDLESAIVRSLFATYFAAVCGCALTVQAQSASENTHLAVEYRLSFDHAKNHYVDVELQLDCAGRPEVELLMPVWTPGSYLVREYARHVEQLKAFAHNSDEPLRVTKPSKNRWSIKTNGLPRVVVRYRVYGREMSVRTNWVDDQYAILNGAATFLTDTSAMKKPHRVTLRLPPHWKQSVSALPLLPDAGPHEYQAHDFDMLVDSPILVGNPDVYRFQVGEREHLLVNVGEDAIWNGAASAKDVATIVREHQRLWGVTPYDRYVFFNVISEARGGLEHDNSTLMMTSRWNFRIRKNYLRWLGLVSHEFYHTWNIRRLRPIELIEYDYENENYFPTLWIAEGITSYYDDLALVRSKLMTEEEYLEALSKQIETLQTTPGRQIQSLQASSHDTWIKFYRPDENSRNSRVSYYTKGAVVAFLLDARIRKQTQNDKSLDDVMRLLYERHAGPRGYTSDDFRQLASHVAGVDLGSWFASTIDSTSELDYTEALAWYGLEFGDKKKDKESTNGKNTTDDEQPAIWLGLTTKAENGKLVIARVERDSAASEAGLNVDDELLGLGGFRVSPADWQERLLQYKPGEEHRILVSRRGKLRELSITFAKKPTHSWNLHPIEQATDAHANNRNLWLHLK